MKKFIFGMQIKIEVFYKLITCTPNKKFAYSLQYFQKNVGHEVDFLLVDKHGSFLQVDIIILSVCSQVFPNYPK